jgi:hypothetical protein
MTSGRPVILSALVELGIEILGQFLGLGATLLAIVAFGLASGCLYWAFF